MSLLVRQDLHCRYYAAYVLSVVLVVIGDRLLTTTYLIISPLSSFIIFLLL